MEWMILVACDESRRVNGQRTCVYIDGNDFSGEVLPGMVFLATPCHKVPDLDVVIRHEPVPSPESVVRSSRFFRSASRNASASSLVSPGIAKLSRSVSCPVAC